MRGPRQLHWLWLLLLHGCRSSPSEPAPQAAVTHPAPCSSSPRAPIRDRAGLVEALRTLQACDWSAITPRAIANTLGAELHASESGTSWEFATDHELLQADADAPAQDASASWIHFHFKTNLGLTLALIEALYGSRYETLPPGKNTSLIFEPPDGSYVAIELFGNFATPKPAALVYNLQLRPRAPQKAGRMSRE